MAQFITISQTFADIVGSRQIGSLDARQLRLSVMSLPAAHVGDSREVANAYQNLLGTVAAAGFSGGGRLSTEFPFEQSLAWAALNLIDREAEQEREAVPEFLVGDRYYYRLSNSRTLGSQIRLLNEALALNSDDGYGHPDPTFRPAFRALLNEELFARRNSPLSIQAASGIEDAAVGAISVMTDGLTTGAAILGPEGIFIVIVTSPILRGVGSGIKSGLEEVIKQWLLQLGPGRRKNDDETDIEDSQDPDL